MPGGSAFRALARRTAADLRTATAAYAAGFAALAAATAAGYRHSYPTAAERLQFARTFGANTAVRLFYGVPHNLVTVGGFTAWRAGGVLTVLAGVFGLVAATRVSRGEEEAGRRELALAGGVSRGGAFCAACAAVALCLFVLWLALVAALAASSLSLGGSCLLALSIVAAGAVFGGVGALAAEVLPTKRQAREAATGVLCLALVARAAADTGRNLSSVRWATPLGWVEEIRPFAGVRPLALLPLAVLTALLFAAAGAIAVRRDVGAGLLGASDDAPPRRALLGSTTRAALRAELPSLAVWLLGVSVFAFVLGVVAKTVTVSSLSPRLREELQRVGGASVATPAGYLGLTFLFFVLAVSLLACAQVGALRHEEESARLDVLLALPVGRVRWLVGRLAVAVGAAAGVGLAAGLVAWAGARTVGAHVELMRMLEAGANCLPCGLLFLGVGVCLFGLWPRTAVGLSYSLVAVAFVWELVGSLVGAPGWLLGASPFHHVGLVPAQAFRPAAALVMLGAAAAAVLVGATSFRRRDLAGA